MGRCTETDCESKGKKRIEGVQVKMKRKGKWRRHEEVIDIASWPGCHIYTLSTFHSNASCCQMCRWPDMFLAKENGTTDAGAHGPITAVVCGYARYIDRDTRGDCRPCRKVHASWLDCGHFPEEERGLPLSDNFVRSSSPLRE